jgi:hypothetical protein
MEMITPKKFRTCPCCGSDSTIQMGASATPNYYAECTDEDCRFNLSHRDDEALMMLWVKVAEKMAGMTAAGKEEFRNIIELANGGDIR